MRFHPLLLLLIALVALPAHAADPKIGFHPQTGRYAVVCQDTPPGQDVWRSVFLDADGNRLTSPLALI